MLVAPASASWNSHVKDMSDSMAYAIALVLLIPLEMARAAKSVTPIHGNMPVLEQPSADNVSLFSPEDTWQFVTQSGDTRRYIEPSHVRRSPISSNEWADTLYGIITNVDNTPASPESNVFYRNIAQIAQRVLATNGAPVKLSALNRDEFRDGITAALATSWRLHTRQSNVQTSMSDATVVVPTTGAATNYQPRRPNCLQRVTLRESQVE